MRGGFVACVGGDARTLGAAADRLRFHRGGRAVHHQRDGLAIIAFTDAAEGPAIEWRERCTRLVHGGPPAPLEELERTGTRFVALEWDGRTLRAGRDPFGLAPLFYRVAGPALWLASEVEALLAPGTPGVDLEALSARAAGAPLDERTGWLGIHRVLPGSRIQATLPELAVGATPYWTAPRRLLATYRGSRADAAAELRTRLETAVRRCGTGPGAVLLSGGLDSAAVALLRSPRHSPPHLVHVRFPSLPATHEQSYAEAVAAAVEAPLHTVEGDAAAWDVDAELDLHGIPYSWLPYGMDKPALSHLAARGLSLALDGHDGDGVLGPRAAEWGTLLLDGELRRLAALGRRDGPARVLRGLAADFTPPLLRPGRLRPHTPARRVGPYFHQPLRSRSLAANDPWAWPSRRWASLQLLPLAPRATVSFEQKEVEAAAHGIDLRHPFADRELVEFLVSLPCAVKGDPGRPKALLVDALGDALPGSLRMRPKSDYLAAVRTRVDPSRCLEEIRASRLRLPLVDYERLFSDARSDPGRVPIHLVIGLARAHRFAARAASASGLRRAAAGA